MPACVGQQVLIEQHGRDQACWLAGETPKAIPFLKEPLVTFELSGLAKNSRLVVLKLPRLTRRTLGDFR